MTQEPTLLFETLHGSRAYGLAREGSDTDLKGVIVGPRAWYFGLEPGPEQVELSADHVRWELRKLLRLAAASNPTVIEVLFADDADHVTVTPAGERLLAARDGMLSLKVADTFGGYAHGQLARIQRHRRWLLEPPAAPPTRAQFDLPERATLPKDQLGAATRMLETGELDEAELPTGFLARLANERRFRAAQKEWGQFVGWQKHRNAKRAALEAQHGYDTKHAMHLVRLGRMAVEILEHGEVRVRRDDREELLAIRDGAWSYDTLMEHAEALRQQREQAKRTSSLPKAPDAGRLDALCQQLIAETFAC
ncbi:MAG: nucleotidyltransferase domain-containing protein [Sandaracinaceae bacterium]